MAQSVTLQLPEGIYERVLRTAEATQRSIEEVLVRTIEAGMPPTVDDLPLSYREEFLAMERLRDEELLEIAQSVMPAAQQRRYSALLRKNQQGTITENEGEQLTQLGAIARKLTLQKAHAYAILKWRGRSIPALPSSGKTQ